MKHVVYALVGLAMLALVLAFPCLLASKLGFHGFFIGLIAEIIAGFAYAMGQIVVERIWRG